VAGQSLRQIKGGFPILSVARTTLFFLIVGNPAASPQTLPTKQKSLSCTPRPDIVFVQTPVLAARSLAQRFPKGSRIVRLALRTALSTPVPLTDGFFAAADPQINFEGTKVLFSGQKSQGERWQIWEMDLDGTDKRQVTQCTEDCVRATYLPGGQIAVAVEEVKGNDLQSYLAVAKMDGSEFRRITFGTAAFQLETILRDGRIVASAPWPLVDAKQTNGARLLYTLRPDGTALESFRCEHSGAAIETEAAELEDNSLVFIQKARTGSPVGGQLVQIRQGAPAATALGTRQAVYQSPQQLSEQELLVAKSVPATVDSAGRFDLYTLNLKTGTLGERLFSDPKFSSIEAVPVAPRAVPKHYWSTLNSESASGYFISLNSYLSADAPRGHFSTPIAQVRVLSVNSGDGKERNLGEAPVESDGSFYVRVPANQPVRFVLLDAKGQTIREERSWVWTRPGEERGCTGCHGDKAVAPENHWPLTLRRFDTPTPLGENDHASKMSRAN
jgi:hypothetical protein